MKVFQIFIALLGLYLGLVAALSAPDTIKRKSLTNDDFSSQYNFAEAAAQQSQEEIDEFDKEYEIWNPETNNDQRTVVIESAIEKEILQAICNDFDIDTIYITSDKSAVDCNDLKGNYASYIPNNFEYQVERVKRDVGEDELEGSGSAEDDSGNRHNSSSNNIAEENNEDEEQNKENQEQNERDQEQNKGDQEENEGDQEQNKGDQEENKGAETQNKHDEEQSKDGEEHNKDDEEKNKEDEEKNTVEEEEHNKDAIVTDEDAVYRHDEKQEIGENQTEKPKQIQTEDTGKTAGNEEELPNPRETPVDKNDTGIGGIVGLGGETRTEEDDTKTVEVNPKTVEDDAKTEEAGTKIEKVDQKIGETDPKTGETDPETGESAPKIDGIDATDTRIDGTGTKTDENQESTKTEDNKDGETEDKAQPGTDLDFSKVEEGKILTPNAINMETDRNQDNQARADDSSVPNKNNTELGKMEPTIIEETQPVLTQTNFEATNETEHKKKSKSLLASENFASGGNITAANSGESTKETQRASKDTSILLFLFIGVVVVGAAAFGYHFITKRKQHAEDIERIERGPSALKRSIQSLTKLEQPEQEMKPLINQNEVKEQEMMEIKSGNGTIVENDEQSSKVTTTTTNQTATKT